MLSFFGQRLLGYRFNQPAYVLSYANRRRLHVVEGISDRVVALDHGEKLTEGGFHEVANHPGVIEAYLGRNPEALQQ